jgi:hypothetical protein
MRHQGFQLGIIFNHFPEFMFFTAKIFSSEADYFLKISRFISKDPTISADQQIFRDVRKGDLDEGQLQTYFSSLGIDLSQIPAFSELTNEDPKNIGGWFILKSIVEGFRPKCEDDNISKYLDFVITLCNIDKQFISKARGMAPVIDFPFLNQTISDWLPTVELDFENVTDTAKASYLISLVLHWAAIYENFLTIEFGEPDGEHGYESLIAKCLPRVNEKGVLERSNSVFLERIKNKWAKNHYNKGYISWSVFFIDIANAIQKERANTEGFELNDLLLIDPDISEIKQRFFRWRKGTKKKNKDGDISHIPTFIQLSDFDKYITFSVAPEKVKVIDLSVWVFVFLQLFELIQFEVQKLGLTSEFIVEKFGEYEKYQNIVSERYECFLKTNEVKA